jgi:hypothetical protein
MRFIDRFVDLFFPGRLHFGGCCHGPDKVIRSGKAKGRALPSIIFV